jgi:hypothetical protein
MVTFFKVVGWVMATISGLLVWNILPETRAIISCGMVVAFICYGISIVVGVTVKRLIVTNCESFAFKAMPLPADLSLWTAR